MLVWKKHKGYINKYLVAAKPASPRPCALSPEVTTLHNALYVFISLAPLGHQTIGFDLCGSFGTHSGEFCEHCVAIYMHAVPWGACQHPPTPAELGPSLLDIEALLLFNLIYVQLKSR